MKGALLILLAILTSCQTNREKNDDKSTIVISSVDIDISTVISIKCDEFDNSFDSTDLRKKNINKRESVESFLIQLSQLELDNDKRNPDTRAKIIIKNAATADTICADRFSLKYRDKHYIMSKQLRKDIWSD